MPLSHLFLSHSSADDGFVRELRQALADLGQEVWIDSRQLKGGDPLESEIKAAIEAASGLAVLVSAASLQSRWVGKELRHGLEIQKQRGRDRFAVVPLSLDGTRLGVLEEFFGEEPTYIPVSSAPGGATAAIDGILVALGLRLPGDRPPVVQPRPEPVEELVLELSNLGFHEDDGKRRAAGTAQLIFQPATAGQRAVESGKWRLVAPLGPIEAEELGWYLERWPVWPNPVLAERAKTVEANLKAWGQELHAAALPPEHTAVVLQAWAGVGANASRRFSVSVDPALEAGVSADETATAQEAATALLALPWELLHSGDGFLFQGARPTRVRRRLPNTRHLSVPVVAPPIRVLLITARPEDEACGYLDHRASAGPLVSATEELGDLLKLTLLHPATYAGLEAELARAQQAGEPYHVVHFDGHGVYDSRKGLGGLCFEDPNDRSKLSGRRHETVFTDRLGPLLNDYRIPLVVLEACQSAQAEAGGESVASELLQRGVSSVVAMSHSVLVDTAKRFVKAFYGELAKGQRVGQAMLAGQQALHSDPSRGHRYGIGELSLADWFVPVLYQEENDPQLFTAIPAPQTTEALQARLRARLGEVPPEPVDTGFVGRSRDLLALERLLQQERWAVVRGQGGEGKTALAGELARWLVRSQQVKRAAFVSVEFYSHGGAVLDALGRQLVGGDYSAAMLESPEQALQPIERALKEQATLVVIDNMESVLLPPYLEAPELLSEAAAEELQAILDLAQRMLRAGDTRIVFTSREALPAPFHAERQRRELQRLGRSDAVALVERSLAAGDSNTGGASEGAAQKGGALEAQREEIEALVDAVQGHARTLALLGPELRRRGVAATQAALVELMEQMQRQVAHLPADDPRRREQSLFASVELSLRRLSADNRERVRVLGVFQGGVALDVLRRMTGWKQAEVEELAAALVGTGLATANPYNHFSLNPALCTFLKASLSEADYEPLYTSWLEAMLIYVYDLEGDRGKDTQRARLVTLLDLPNIIALLNFFQSASDAQTKIDLSKLLYDQLQNLGRTNLLARLADVCEAALLDLGDSWSHHHFKVMQIRIGRQIASRNLRDALPNALELLTQAEAAGEMAYFGADYDLAMANFILGQVFQKSGDPQQALALLKKASRQFTALASNRGSDETCEIMSTICLTEQGGCLLNLGQYDSAATAYKEAILSCRKHGAQRTLAVAKVNLGTALYKQGGYSEALDAFHEACATFLDLNEPGAIGDCWHQIGMVYEKTCQPILSEEAYINSLTVKTRLNDQGGQGRTLGQLGTLYNNVLLRPEQAVIFFQKAADISRDIGDVISEVLWLENLAESFRKLQRLENARLAINRAIECIEGLKYDAISWKVWDIHAAIETEAGSPDAAAISLQKARSSFVDYRRDGGKNNYRTGCLALSIYHNLSMGDTVNARSIINQSTADSDWAESLPFLTALQAITDGSRDRSLAENPCLHYTEAAEVMLLIEALEAGAGGEAI